MSRLALVSSHLVSDLFVAVEQRGEVGFLVMRHRAPRPANEAALTVEMRRSLLCGLRALQANESVKVIVLTSDSPRVFSSGVNQESFGDALVEDTVRQIPSLAGLCEAVESSSKLVVAYVQGSCASWGLELAMAAPFRVALRNARFRFPEVQLGLVPCGGGAQRLVQLVGVRQSLLMLCSGKSVTATEAKAIGLVDAVVAAGEATVDGADGGTSAREQLLALVRGYAAAVAQQQQPFVPRARRCGRVGLVTTNAVHFAWMEHKIRDHAPRHVQAPYACLLAVRLATRHAGEDFAAGLQRERGLFITCLARADCMAMQHVLQASARTLSNAEPRLHASLLLSQQLLPFRHAAVIGAGTIGTSVAFLLLQHGLRVTIVEIDEARREQVLRRLTAETQAAATMHRRISAAEADLILRRLSVVGSHYEPFPAVVAEADLVVECVPEVASTKKNLFAHLDKLCNRGCVFVSCTASMDVGGLAAVTQRPEQVLGLQPYPPANMNPLLEVSTTPLTDMSVVRRVLALADKLQKHVVMTQHTVGHVGTHLLLAGLYAAYTMLEDGSFPMEVDSALTKTFHFRTGIFELEDLIGLDATAMARLEFQQRQGAVSAGTPWPRRRAVYDVADGLVRDGLVGRKRGEGWYRYKETIQLNPEHDAKDDEVPLRLPSLSAVWSPLSWRSGQLMPPGQCQTLLAERDMAVAPNRAVEHRVLRVCKAKRIARRDILESEIVERVVLSMINEAAQLLGSGVAGCAADIDCLSVHALGFPAWKGGLLYYADRVLGIDGIVRRINLYRGSIGEDAFPEPCETLLDMSRKHQTFANAFPAASAE